MLKKALGNLLVRKLLVFTGVLTITLAALGGISANWYDAQMQSASWLAPACETGVSEQAVLAPMTYAPIMGGLGSMLTQVSHNDEPDSGSISLSDWRPRNTDLTLRETPPVSDKNTASRVEDTEESDGFKYCSEIPLSKELQKHTYEEAMANGLEYELVLALMWRESRFKTEAVNVNRNGTRDNGIMQINDVNKGWLSRDLGITDLMDPKQNISAGTAMLGQFADKYGVHNALLAYQYGEAGMERQISKGVTTNKQIQIVYAKKADFEALLA